MGAPSNGSNLAAAVAAVREVEGMAAAAESGAAAGSGGGMEAAGQHQLVYFIQAASGLIKIGISKNPLARFADMQVSNGGDLKLLATMPGGRQVERDLHTRLAAHRVRGEWFSPHRDVLAAIERASAFDQALPPRKEKWVGDPSRGARLEELADYIRITWPLCLKLAFGDGPDAVKKIADVTGLTRRAVELWMLEKSTPSAPAMLSVAMASSLVARWYRIVSAVYYVASTLNISIISAARMVTDDPSLIIESERAPSGPLHTVGQR